MEYFGGNEPDEFGFWLESRSIDSVFHGCLPFKKAIEKHPDIRVGFR